MADKLKKYTFQRRMAMNDLETLLRLSNSSLTEVHKQSLFRVRYSELDDVLESFNKNHQNIVTNLLNSEPTDAQLDSEDIIRSQFLNDYYQIKANFADLFENDDNSQKNEQNIAASNAVQPPSNVRLPQLELVKFSGEFTSAITFFDLFDALVHRRPNVDDTEKLTYLIQSLEGPPLRLAKSLPLARENYVRIYDKLKNRYLNKRLRAMAHWCKIEEAPATMFKNSDSYSNLIDTFSENLSALENLGYKISDFVLAYKILTKLDEETHQRFELLHGSSEMPTFIQLSDFLESQCISFDSSLLSPCSPKDSNRKNKSPSKHNANKNGSKVNNRYSFFSKPNATTCLLCSADHHLKDCSLFLNKSPYERYNACKRMRLCFKCLEKHDSRSCSVTSRCCHCNSSHHSLLHFKSSESATQGATSVAAVPTTASSDAQVNTGTLSSHAASLGSVTSKNSSVLLATAVVEIMDGCGLYQPVRALIDGGSMTSFVSQSCIRQLGIRHSSATLSVQGIGAIKSTVVGRVDLQIKPVDRVDPIFNCEAFVLPKICEDLPVVSLDVGHWSYIANLKLADPRFHLSGKVDLLLGADIFSQLLLEGKVQTPRGMPDALNTVFGYVLMGPCSSVPMTSATSLFCHVDQMVSLEESVKQFWSLETVPEVECSAPEDILCEKNFVENVCRDGSGRYTVALPFRELSPVFPGMFELAVNRFLSLEKRLLKNPSVYQEYCTFMKDYLDLHHMELVSETSRPLSCYYIPHHAVLKPDSLTTKLRVVFNASARIGNQNSLNQCLFTGKKLQQDILTILLGFRLHKYVLSTDIKQMYRQIRVEKSHCDYQRIVFRFSPDEELQEFRLLTVTYGVSSAPFLALRTLLQLSEDEGREFPLAAEVLRTSTYVDDIVCGGDTLEIALDLRNELISLLSRGQFELRKWSSNDMRLLEGLPESHIGKKPISFDDNSCSSPLKILGLVWNAQLDCFSFEVTALDKSCTKRSMLSELARVFDPVGFLAPMTLFTKHLIQRLWLSGIDWDDSPPDSICKVWNQYKEQLLSLAQLEIPRCMFVSRYICCEVHGFCDSSEKGYAAVIYLRFVLPDGQVCVFFVCAKSKVAPIRTVSIPRLELSAAVLLSKLMQFVVRVLDPKLKIAKFVAWSDSQVALSWIKSSPHRWKTFVSNRVSYIQERLSPNSWFYVPSAQNPADLASRGVLPALMLEQSHWFAGPEFLYNTDPIPDASCCFSECAEMLDEERTVTLACVNDDNFLENLLNDISDFSFIRRLIAWILRFAWNSKFPNDKREGPLSSKELYESLIMLVKYTQHRYFEREFEGNVFSKPLRKLSCFIDDQGVLRVGSRLRYLSVSIDKKFPCILPRESRLTYLLIDYYHKRYCHAGLRTVSFLLAQSFWILSPKRAIRSVLSKCIQCWRPNPRNYQPPMGNLPLVRISQVKPFLNSGMDFGGPFYVVMNRYRGAKSCKVYLCLFVCMATKALHLELASDLSSETFLSALQRFIARRGRVDNLYSDRGSNFVGAAKYLNLMKNAASNENISFHFNAASAAHFGGLWEAGIKSVKTHLARVIGDQILSYEELNTVVIQIESYLNSRPLTPISSDPNDLSVLTPGHFLNLEPLSAVFEPLDGAYIPASHLMRWKLINQMHKTFWERWSKEYLHTLHQRSKWTSSDNLKPIELGTMVLIKDDNIPPSQWRLGRISQVFPGQDGIIRVADVKTTKGILRRPLVKLCPLPI